MSSPVKVSVLGVGLSATVFHIPFILSLPGVFSLHSILERSATPTHSVAREKYGTTGVKVVTSFDDVLNDPEVDCVVIGTPNSTHYQFAKSALQAGKHVIIEKPLTPTSQEANELIALAASHTPPLILAAYQNRRLDSDFLTLKRLLETEKVFGDISEFETRFDRWRPVLKGQTWKEESGIGQGVVYDLGSHLIDQVLDLFGMPETITAHIHNSRRVGPADFDDAFTARLYYPSRPIPLTVNLSAGVFSLLDPEPRYVVKGTKASWVKFGVDPQEDQLRAVPPVTLASTDFALESETIQGMLSTLDESGKIVTRRIPSERGNYQAWFQSVGEAIQSRDPTELIVKPEQARDVIRVIELMYQSSKEGRTIQVTK